MLIGVVCGACRMGSVEPFTIIEGPEAWYAKDYTGRADWINHLTPQHIAGAAQLGLLPRNTS